MVPVRPGGRTVRHLVLAGLRNGTKTVGLGGGTVRQVVCRTPELPVSRHLDITQCNTANRLRGPQILYSE